MASVIPKSNRQRRHEARDAPVVSTPHDTRGISRHEVTDAITEAQQALGLSDEALARRAGVTMRALRYVKTPTVHLQSQQRRPLRKIIAYLESQVG